MDINVDLHQPFTKFLMKSLLLLVQINLEVLLLTQGHESENQQLAEELHKPVVRKCKKRKVCLSFKDSIWGANVANMQLISKYDKGIFMCH